MLDIFLAKKLIEQVTKYTSYNVNIMDNRGVIIASRNPERIGNFHEVAWQIVQGNEDTIIIENDNDYPGVLSGINMVIEIEGNREGVVGVTGNPEEIRPIAFIIKLAIETLIKYEYQKMQALRRQSRKDRFLEMLTQENYKSPQDIRNLAAELNYKEEIVRIPVLCRLESQADQQKLLDIIKSSQAHLSEDISFLIDDCYVLVFKTLDSENTAILSDYKFVLAEYLKPALKWILENDIKCSFYIGTFQTSFSQYYYAYRHCKWMETYSADKTRHRAYYFYDCIGEYLTAQIPRKELHQIFNVFHSNLSKEFKQNYIEIIGSLIKCNFNIQNAAQQIFMHKNTFTYRYNKIRDKLNIDHQSSMEEKWLLIFLYLYLNN